MAENIQSGRFLKPALIYVSSLLAPHLVFLPRLPHSQWFPISFFRFFMQSQLLVRASFPRYFSLFPPYLTINKNHLFFIPPSWQNIVQSQTPPGPYLNPLSKIAHFSLLSSMNTAPWQLLQLSFLMLQLPCHAMPSIPRPQQLPFTFPITIRTQCWLLRAYRTDWGTTRVHPSSQIACPDFIQQQQQNSETEIQGKSGVQLETGACCSGWGLGEFNSKLGSLLKTSAMHRLQVL